SLRRRPMRRVTEPLRAMGAEIQEKGGDALPLSIRGGRLHALTYTTPVASAQIKSALLLAGLTGNVSVTIREPYRSRDHTERLFAHLGLGLHERAGAIVYEPSGRNVVPPFRLSIPGDASSAAFLVAAAVLAEGGELGIEHVGVNPTRTGFLVGLERMGAHVERMNLRDEGGEPVADLVGRPGRGGGRCWLRDGVRAGRRPSGRGGSALRACLGGYQLPAILRRLASHRERGKGKGETVTLRVVAIDGPAASGKSSTASLVA